MDDRISTYLSVALVFGAQTIVYSLLAMIPTALLCHFFGWPFFSGGLPLTVAGAASAAFVRLLWYFKTRGSRSENEDSPRKSGKARLAKWAKIEPFILVFFAIAIVFFLAGMLLTGIGYYIFGLPVSTGVLVLIAVGSLGASLWMVWQMAKNDPDWF